MCLDGCKSVRVASYEPYQANAQYGAKWGYQILSGRIFNVKTLLVRRRFPHFLLHYVPMPIKSTSKVPCTLAQPEYVTHSYNHKMQLCCQNQGVLHGGAFYKHFICLEMQFSWPGRCQNAAIFVLFRQEKSSTFTKQNKESFPTRQVSPDSDFIWGFCSHLSACD